MSRHETITDPHNLGILAHGNNRLYVLNHPEPSMASAELKERVEAILAPLTALQRESVEMVIMENVSPREAAAMLGVDVEAIYGRLKAARRIMIHGRPKPNRPGRPPKPSVCGSDAAYMRHRRRGEPICRTCKDGMNARRRARRLSNRTTT